MGDDCKDGEGGETSGLFDAFVARDSPALLRTAWGLTGDRAAAEDLVQAALERIWLRWHFVRDQAQPGGYARKVVVSLFLSSRRRRWTNEVVVDHADHVDPRAVHGDAADVIALRAAVVAALSALPPKQRAVAVLRYLEDMTEAQTALILGCSRGSVKTHASRALRALRSNPHLIDEWSPAADQKESTR